MLGPWLEHLASNVEFQVGNDPPRVGRDAVAEYFAPLLTVMGACTHELLSISPIDGVAGAWAVRGNLKLTRAKDGQAIPVIGFADALFFGGDGGLITRYEIRFDPAPIGQLFG